MASQTLRLRESRAIAQVGGKGANLGELTRIGQPVPDGFVVTTEALAGVSGALPDPLADEIRERYAALGAGPVAVRSSATAEDLPGATFAGQQDTILEVEGAEQVLAAVAECAASLYGTRAVAYRTRLGITDDQVAIAVVVQRMVPAEVAGVMFTADPVTGRRDRRSIDAHPGLGEAVVSGEVIPDHLLTDPSGHITNWTAGEADGSVTVSERPAPNRHSTGHHNPGQPVLTDQQVRELVRHGEQVAAHFGCPQDIEWAFADGRLHILQARPMTALPPPPVELNRIERTMASIILDYLTVRPYPLDLTTWIPYGPVGMMARISEDLGLAGAYGRLFEQHDGVVTAVTITAPRPRPRLLSAPLRVIPRLRRFDPARWAEDPRAVELSDQVTRLAAQDVTTLDRDALVARVRECFGLASLVTGLRRDFLPATGAALARLTVLLALLGRRRLGPELTQGAPTQTTAGNTALAALADLARDDTPLVARIEAQDMAGVRQHPGFAKALDDWLERYGHRETTSPVLISQPTLAESPETVLSLLRVLIDTPPRALGPRPDALAELLTHPLLRSPRRREWAIRIVEAARAAIGFREDSHGAFTRIAPVLRATLLEIGRRLTAEGVLDAVDDVWHCRWDELVTVPRGDLRRRVTERRRQRQLLEGVPLINVANRTAEVDDAQALVSGTPASSGEASGPVRVIRDPKDFGTLRSGEVLVCPYTNPAWTPLFQRVAAVVVDSGGSGSHAAIVAREYRIPAVMGTGTGTTLLTDGLRVRVDGDHGLVLADA